MNEASPPPDAQKPADLQDYPPPPPPCDGSPPQPPPHQPIHVVPVVGQPVYRIAGPTNGLATASLTLGILAIVLAWVPVIGVLLGVIGLGLGVPALTTATGTGTGKTTALWGLSLSAVAIMLFIVIVVALA